MVFFGIESSCDDTAASVLDVAFDGGNISYRLLSNVVSSQIDIHARYGGVVPEIASRAHAESISAVAEEALSKAGLSWRDIEAVAVTFAPGLIGSLLVGVSYAKALAFSLGIPLIPVNHIEAHAAAAYLEHPELKPPALALIVSGGHTSFYGIDASYALREIGSTRDDAAGEAFDKVGRVLGLPYPGGAAMDALASRGFSRDTYKDIKLPSPALPGDGLEFSFSGLKTAAINHIHNQKQKLSVPDDGLLPEEMREDIAAALTSAIVGGVTDKLAAALKANHFKYAVLAGGVAANSHLRSAAAQVCSSMGVTLCVPSLPLCGDNGAMTAAAGAMLYRQGISADLDLNAFASDEAAEEYLGALRANFRK